MTVFLLALASARCKFTIRFLRHGTFLVQPEDQILEVPNRLGQIGCSSPDCSGCKSRGSNPALGMNEQALCTSSIFQGYVYQS
jgi:hypothetical protein